MKRYFDFESANKVHKNFYKYDKVICKGSKTRVIITCPIHGEFLQTPYAHIIRKQGCKKCQYEKYKVKFSFSPDEFITNAKKVHGNKYDYSDSNYVNSQTKVKIICPNHGIFYQLPLNHVNHKKGCPGCKFVKLSDLYKFNTEQFITNARKIHGNKYDYSMVDYIDMRSKVKIVCSNHGPFFQTATNHIHLKNGCPHCGYNSSIKEREWLNSMGIPLEYRQKIITIDKIRYKTDAYDKDNKIVYEFFGYFWHGHPDYFNPDDVNPRNNVKFGELYQRTLDKINHIQSSGFTLISKWG